MPEQNKKQTRLWPVILISAIILVAVVIWAIVKQQPAEQTHAEHHHIFENSKFEIPEASLNDIIKAARTWGPAHESWFGKPAPDFTLTDVNGKQHKLSGYRGKSVLVIFWATWCPPCKIEIPDLIELRNTVSEDTLAMLAISNEDPALVKKFIAEWRMNYTVLLDKGNMPTPFGFMRVYRTSGVPCSFFIDAEGKIKFATAGLISLDEIKAILQAE